MTRSTRTRVGIFGAGPAGEYAFAWLGILATVPPSTDELIYEGEPALVPRTADHNHARGAP